jgi:hypothetical protein
MEFSHANAAAGSSVPASLAPYERCSLSSRRLVVLPVKRAIEVQVMMWLTCDIARSLEAPVLCRVSVEDGQRGKLASILDGPSVFRRAVL